MATPVSFFMRSAAASMARNESLLQHLGPPYEDILSRQEAVILIGILQTSFSNGPEPRTMLANVPALSAAPQHPQFPHTAPGTWDILLINSGIDASRSVFPPLFL